METVNIFTQKTKKPSVINNAQNPIVKPQDSNIQYSQLTPHLGNVPSPCGHSLLPVGLGVNRTHQGSKSDVPVKQIKVFQDSVPANEDKKQYLFHSNGNIKEIQEYDEKKRPILQKTYDSDGQALLVRNYEYNESHDAEKTIRIGEFDVKTNKKVVTTTNGSGNVIEIVEKDNNTEDSRYSKFNDAGVLVYDDIYKEGENTFLTYYDDGPIQSKKTDTTEELFSENGKIRLFRKTDKEKNTEHETHYNEDGSIQSQTDKLNGEIVLQKVQNSGGILIPTEKTVFNEKGYKKTTYDWETAAVQTVETAKDGEVKRYFYAKPTNPVLEFEHKKTSDGYIENTYNEDGSPSEKTVVAGQNKTVIQYDENNKPVTTYSKTVKDGTMKLIERDIDGTVTRNRTENDGEIDDFVNKIEMDYSTRLIKTKTKNGSIEKIYFNKNLDSVVTTDSTSVKYEKIIRETDAEGKKSEKTVKTYEKTITPDGYTAESYDRSGRLQIHTEVKGNNTTTMSYNRKGEIVSVYEQTSEGSKININKNDKLETFVDFKRKDLTENHFITTNNGISHDVVFSKESIKVTNQSTRKTNTIDLNKLLSDVELKDKEDFVKVLKGLSGDTLEDLSFEIGKIHHNTTEDYFGAYDYVVDKITTIKSSQTLTHEIGHALDYRFPASRSSIDENKEFKTVFRKEMEEFKNSNWEAIRMNKPKGEKAGSAYATKSEKEMFAEIYTLITTGKNDSSECILLCFPKSFEIVQEQIAKNRALDENERR